MPQARHTHGRNAAPRTGGRVAEHGLGLTGYGVVAGIAATAIGALASSAFAGGARIGVWIGVTAVLAVALAWSAEPAVMLLSRWLRHGRRLSG